MIIFDLDGTLADCEHRRHYVDLNKNRCPSCKPPFASRIDSEKLPCPDCGFNASRWRPDWQAFYEACDEDKPILPVINALKWAIQNEIFEIWSGRCESVREKTLDWICKHTKSDIVDRTYFNQILKMRPRGDSTPDDELKERWLDHLIANSCKTVECVYDDRPKVVRMWRRRGIFVFNCNQNDEEF